MIKTYKIWKKKLYSSFLTNMQRCVRKKLLNIYYIKYIFYNFYIKYILYIILNIYYILYY